MKILSAFKNILSVLFFCSVFIDGFAQDVVITVNANENKIAISPYIYGKNNTFDKPAQFYKDAGLRFVRMCGGNNATKYNWRKKITSHPDWYNNVYKSNDWDENSLKIAADHPNMQVMWAFQLLGRVASSTEHNFNDWEFNQSQWWKGVHQNLAGGGEPNTGNPDGDALIEGDVNLYTQEWPTDSTLGILDHWFGENGIGLDKNQFMYWDMDNEPDIWNGTHDDVMSDGQLPAAEFMGRYFEVAKKARALFPEIKICGPVVTNEWQWFRWGDEDLRIGSKYYCWLEYFIKRVADEEKATGVRLLDVVDLHSYLSAPDNSVALQNHRVYYDKNYAYPGASGLKTINGGWNNSLNKEYIFQRIEDWLVKHFGEGNDKKIGLSEWSPSNSNPNVAAVVYASHLGTFANNGIDFFTPWTWETGMWETLHLFSRYSKEYSVSSASSNENIVSAYSTTNEAADSMTVIIVNRDQNSSRNVTINLNEFPVGNGNYTTLQLASLPANETFESHTSNALKENLITINSNSFTLTVPSLSTTAVLLKAGSTGINDLDYLANQIKIYPNPATDQLKIKLNSNIAELTFVTVFDQAGREILKSEIQYDGFSPISLNILPLTEGFYLISVKNSHCTNTKSLIVNRNK
ncbi:MAG: T9SS type A sorting domain-containing protein [Bacteroidales bacterium]|nr:T9SS type A sorting domain-containing protein [Bacteroidales bacterium]